jgi:signal transduction histidine kinase
LFSFALFFKILLIILILLRIRDFINSRSKSTIVIFGIILVLLVGLIDLVTGVAFSFSIFYLIPISLVAWYAGKSQALSVAVIGAVAWLWCDMQDIQRYTNQAIPYWNALVRFGFFVVVIYLISALKVLNDELEKKVRSRTSDLIAEINERKNTEKELHRKSEKLRQLIKRTQNIREEENSKIAREIHDVLGQALTAIKIETISLSKKFSNNSELVDRLFVVVNTVDDTIKSIREISTRLRPRLLDELGLLPAVELQLREFQTRTGIRCNLSASDENLKLDSTVSTALFRIFQEAITNVARHAEATNVKIRINNSAAKTGLLTMEIIDNGIGLPHDYSEKSQSLGILGMKERAQILGGTIDFISAEDWGTAVIVNIPINNTTD